MYNNLKMYRLKKNLTQKDIAKKLNIATSTYNMIENGKRKISLEKAKKLSKIFNTSIEKLFFEKIFDENFTNSKTNINSKFKCL